MLKPRTWSIKVELPRDWRGKSCVFPSWPEQLKKTATPWVLKCVLVQGRHIIPLLYGKTGRYDGVLSGLRVYHLRGSHHKCESYGTLTQPADFHGTSKLEFIWWSNSCYLTRRKLFTLNDTVPTTRLLTLGHKCQWDNALTGINKPFGITTELNDPSVAPLDQTNLPTALLDQSNPLHCTIG